MPNEIPVIPPDMGRVYLRLKRWRSSHVRRVPIPESLWAAAGDLARAHGINSTAKALHLEYGKRKQRRDMMKPGGKVIDANFQELTALPGQVRQGPSGEEDCQLLQRAIQGLNIEIIGEEYTTTIRLRALLAKPSTEKTSKVLEQADLGATRKSRSSAPPRANEKSKAGHDRKGAVAYGEPATPRSRTPR
jgi:hypothetical protein